MKKLRIILIITICFIISIIAFTYKLLNDQEKEIGLGKAYITALDKIDINEVIVSRKSSKSSDMFIKTVNTIKGFIPSENYQDWRYMLIITDKNKKEIFSKVINFPILSVDDEYKRSTEFTPYVSAEEVFYIPMMSGQAYLQLYTVHLNQLLMKSN